MKLKEVLKTNRIETPEEGERKARTNLQTFLNASYRAIRAMRAIKQYMDTGTTISEEQLREFDQCIKKESHGRLLWVMGAFCTIGDEDERFEQSDNEFFGAALGKGVKVVKGFHFWFVLKGHMFECLDLDSGLSRRYFDEKDPSGKRAFVQRFAERRRDSAFFVGDPNTLPLGFTAFISDQGDGFKIEELVSYRDSAPPISRFRKKN